MAPTVADAIAQIHQQRGDTEAADAVYERLYASQDSGASDVLAEPDRDLGHRFARAPLDQPRRRRRARQFKRYRRHQRTEPPLRHARPGPNRRLAVVQRGLADNANDPTLLSVKAGVLAMMGRTDDAVQAYEELIQLSPSDASLRVRYARALADDARRPEAEEELLRITREDGPAALSARAALLQIYMQLGLYERAISTVDAVLDRLPLAEDAELDLAIGRVLAHQQRYIEAQQRLGAIPADSPYYATAQIELARNQAEAGDIPSAQSVITRLIQDTATTRRAIAVLIALNPLEANDRALLSTADKLVDVRSLPFDIAQRWLAVRLKLADMRGDWVISRETIELVAQINDDDDIRHRAAHRADVSAGRSEASRRNTQALTKTRRHGHRLADRPGARRRGPVGRTPSPHGRHTHRPDQRRSRSAQQRRHRLQRRAHRLSQTTCLPPALNPARHPTQSKPPTATWPWPSSRWKAA